MKIEAFGLERWMSRHETTARYDLAESGIHPLRLADLLGWLPDGERRATLDRLLELRLGYSEASGTHELRSSIAETYQGCDAENVLVTTGAIEANFLLFNVLLDAGDHVIAPHPAYQQLYSVPRALGCEVSLWEVGAASGYRYDLSALERLVRPATRLIVVNTPHNPTGAMLSAAELARVYALAESVGATVVGDEAYRWLAVPGGEPFAPPMFEHGPRGISVGTISKSFGLPGLRIGWLAAPKPVMAACWGMRDYLSLSPGKLGDVIAQLAFRQRQRILERNGTILAANFAAVERWLARHAEILSWTPPRGGLVALLRYRLDVPSRQLSELLATDYGVMLAPGDAFGSEHHLRIGLGQEPALFQAGLDAASRCLDALCGRPSAPDARSAATSPASVVPSAGPRSTAARCP
jgi:aspartate/methionine/tyrosine aminotransferase